MTVFEKLTEPPELAGVLAEQVGEDMALIVRGEELEGLKSAPRYSAPFSKVSDI
jgi:hypothetical protein